MIDPPVSGSNDGTHGLPRQTTDRLEAVAREFAGQFVYAAPHDPEWDRKVAHIAGIGREEVHALSKLAERAMVRGGARDAEVSAAEAHLRALRAVMERLAPGTDDDALTARKRFGLFPAKRRQISYFARYEAAQSVIEAALSGLMRARDVLLHDSIVVGRLRAEAPPMVTRLQEAVFLCAALDARLEKLARQLAPSDSAKADHIRQTALFTARQRHMDLVTHAAVAQQTVATLTIITHNNAELAKGIERASATTTAALQTAIVAAQTLANHTLVLNQVTGVTNAATGLGAGMAAGAAPDDMTASAQVAALRSALDKAAASVAQLHDQTKQAPHA